MSIKNILKRKDNNFMQPQVKEEEKHARNQAQAQFESIKEMVTNLREARKNQKKQKYDKESEKILDDIEQTIREDILSIEMRSNWHMLGQEAEQGGEFKLLLCWGGPAVQIVGELNEYNEPETATIQFQDWGTPWTEYIPDVEGWEDILLDYCRVFYFGE
jgi:hypothetical protein